MTLAAVRANVGPRVVGAGMAMVAVAFVGYSAAHPHPEAAAPPRPPSAPATEKPSKSARPGPTTSAPSPKPRRGGSDTGVVAVVAAPETGTGSRASRPRPATPSRPAPKPPASSPPAAASCDVGVTVLVLKACVNLGGTR